MEVLKGNDGRYSRLLPVIDALERLTLRKNQITMAIEGHAASGKSTAAALLATRYEANVIHMDDFYLPIKLRTQQRDEEIGGNVHYERFYQEVIVPLGQKKTFSYPVFDCKKQAYVSIETIVPKSLTIIEGAYSLHPSFGDIYDLKVFSSVAEDIQKQRILERNGERLYAMFLQRWIPMENRYFQEFNIRATCDLCI